MGHWLLTRPEPPYSRQNRKDVASLRRKNAADLSTLDIESSVRTDSNEQKLELLSKKRIR